MARSAGRRKMETAETRDQTVIQASEPPDDVPTELSEEVRPSLGAAYRAYVEGRKDLAAAFKEREARDQEAYREAERRYRLCQEAIEKAMRAREKAELDAADAYADDVDRAIDKASQAYKEKTRQALVECKQKVIDAWNSGEASDETAVVWEEAVEKAMKAREKADLDALQAYRQEVDKAVDRASEAYRDGIKQALAACKQQVMDAWRTSMETSAQMTGIFEDDRNSGHEWPPVDRRPDPFGARFLQTVLGFGRRVRLAVRGTMNAPETDHRTFGRSADDDLER